MFASVVDLLYPPACLLCRRRVTESGGVLCEACEGAMAPCLPPLCQRCGVGLLGAYDAKLLCTRCQTRSFAFEQARAPFLYVGMVREAIHAFKYQGRRRIGFWLAAKMARTATRDLPVTEIDRIFPVPMHWLKLRLKGVNPAALLAQAVAKSLKLSCDLKLLQRTRWTPSQTRLGVRERFRNVRGSVQARQRGNSPPAVLLVDDVLTSGATAHACALALREAGVKRVFVLTAACAPIP